jgi:hypothetical protein
MRIVLLVLFVLINTISQAQSIFGVNISTPDGSNDKWSWDNVVGTYANRYNKDQPPFDVVYKFPGKGYVFTTSTGMYQDMPERYNQAYYTIKETFGKPITGYTNVKGFKNDSTDWSVLAPYILTQGGIIEYYFYKDSGSKTIRIILKWDEKGIQALTKHFDLLPKREKENDALKLKMEGSMGHPQLSLKSSDVPVKEKEAKIKEAKSLNIEPVEFTNTNYKEVISYKLTNVSENPISSINEKVTLTYKNIKLPQLLQQHNIQLLPNQSVIITIEQKQGFEYALEAMHKITPKDFLANATVVFN